MRLSVLMPVFNEARTLRTIVHRVLTSPVDTEIEIVAVDDGSDDGSWEILQALASEDARIVPLRHSHNRGKGAAIRTAIEHMSGDIAVVQDSDLEYDPAELPRLIKPIVDGRAEAVFGSRFASSPERRVLLYWHSIGNKFLTWLTNVLNDLNLTDMETCYKAVRADVLKSLRLRSERFGIEPEITTRLAQWGARIYEIPISYHGRTYDEGKSIGWRDGLQAIWLLLRFKFVDTSFSNRPGHEVREVTAGSRRLARWILEQFRGHLGSRILEVGCGSGRMTRLLLDRDRLVAIDIDPFHVEALARRYGHLENVEVLRADLTDAAVYEKLGRASFDTVLAVNVLEYQADPRAALIAMAEALTPQGQLLLHVPANTSLSSVADGRIGHRRFDREQLHALFADTDLRLIEIRQFNRLGALGWVWNRITRRSRVSQWQAWIFGLLLPVGRHFERLRFLPGLTWIVVAEKVGPDPTLKV